MSHTVKIGDKSFTKVIAKLTDLDYEVSLPISGASSYDLIADQNGQLIKVQVKTARVVNGRVVFALSSLKLGKKGEANKRVSYKGRADVVIAYCPELDKFYWLDIDEAGDHFA